MAKLPWSKLEQRKQQENKSLIPEIEIAKFFPAKVTKVHDGDTLTIQTRFLKGSLPLRLLGIDAKELNEEGGMKAKAWLEERILNKNIEVQIEKLSGRWGRLIGTVISEGMNVNYELIWTGNAVPFDKRNLGEIPSFMHMLNEVQNA